MANEEQVSILRQGNEIWNVWRNEHREIIRPDLSGVDLSGANLSRADLSGVDLITTNLSGADLTETQLFEATLTGATLIGSDLSGANLSGAFLSYADFRSANLSRVDLSYADLREADLSGTDLSYAHVEDTHFANVDLRPVKGLASIVHHGPSHLSTDTLIRSQGEIPVVFLRGVGLDDTFITYVRSLVNQSIQYHTCFISYASDNEAFAQRLFADLQNKGVRCWFAPHSLRPGDFIRRSIDAAIRKYDKLILILSEASVKSTWVEFEVEAALEKETADGPTVLFPIRIDETVMQSTTSWAKHIKRNRHIGNFAAWKNHDAYQQAFSVLLEALKTERKA